MRSANTATVLLIEDNSSLRELLVGALDVWGYRVLTAGDGRRGLAIINNEAETIDILLLDITLPFVSGLKLSKVLKRQRPGTKCLMMSGYERSLLSIGDESSNFRFIQKPFTLHELRALIEEMISEGNGRM